jgi:hypothetical protein
MDAGRRREIRGTTGVDEAEIGAFPVDEMVDNLCCTWGERWKITSV